MENHHHEEPKPTNKWIAAPILLAVFFISCITLFLSSKSGPCCEGQCDPKNKTEEHGAIHGDGHSTEVAHDSTSATTDSAATTADSTVVVDSHNSETEHGH